MVNTHTKKVKAIGWERVDRIHVDNNRDKWRDYCEYGNEIWGSVKCGLCLDTRANYFSRTALLLGVN